MTPDPWCTADRHGDRAAYCAGCRCTTARAAAAAYQKRLWTDRKAGIRRLVNSVGTRRRLEALHAMGWTAIALAARLDVTHDAVRLWRGRPLVYARTARNVAALYDELAMTPGPSTLVRQVAARRGWAPPLAWDDDTIDDPAAKPAGVAQPRVSTRAVVHLEDVELLAQCGATWSVTVARLGASRNTIETAAARWGRLDLTHRISANSEGEYSLSARRNQWSA